MSEEKESDLKYLMEATMHVGTLRATHMVDVRLGLSPLGVTVAAEFLHKIVDWDVIKQARINPIIATMNGLAEALVFQAPPEG